MIRIKYVFLVGFLSLLVYACGSNGIGVDNFDHVAQAAKDNDTLVKFLKGHYYDAADNMVKPLVSGKVALSDDPKLKTQSIVEKINDVDINYKLYSYIEVEGTSAKGSPSIVDSVLVNYKGQAIRNASKINPKEFDSNTNAWLVLATTIRGWSYGIPNFKAGTLNPGQNPNEPITFVGAGKGFIIIPSGLGYRNQGRGSNLLPNESLLFYIQLNDFVKDTDSDRDGVPSIKEDVNKDGKPWDDDTDNDRIVNFADPDDDGDGILTIREDANKDGDPTNDFSDPNNPTLPDYLNPKIRKSNQ